MTMNEKFVMGDTFLLQCDVLMVGEWFPTFRKNSFIFKRKAQAIKNKQRFLKTVLCITSRLALEPMLPGVRSSTIKRLGLEAY
jgi:hypothetical protein